MIRRLTAEDAAAFHALRQEAMTTDPDSLATTPTAHRASKNRATGLCDLASVP